MGRASDTLSLHTLSEYTPDSSVDEAPPRYRDAVPQVGRASSPSRSSYFSSPPQSISEWTPDTASEFSEQQPFLSHGATTPPPQYRSPRQSVSTVVGSLDQEVGILLDGHYTPRTHCDDPRKHNNLPGKCECCERRRKKSEQWRVAISVIFVCILIGFILGFVIVSRDQACSCLSELLLTKHYRLEGVPDIENNPGPHQHLAGPRLTALRGTEGTIISSSMTYMILKYPMGPTAHSQVRFEYFRHCLGRLQIWSSSKLRKRQSRWMSQSMAILVNGQRSEMLGNLHLH